VPVTTGPETTSTPADDDLLVAGEVAALLRVTTAWVYAETRRGALPHVRLGRYVRYRRGTLLAWLADQEQQPANSSIPTPAERPRRAHARR
jgi:excisionase family DNA binding protein